MKYAYKWWPDITQGDLGNCYLVASINAISIDPQLVLNNFLTKVKNDAGIYTVKFHIRGKPWLITIDDDMAFYDDKLYFGKIDK